LADPINALFVYNVDYIGTQGISTGLELAPVNDAFLRNVINRGDITLSNDVHINGSLTLEENSLLNTDNHNITLNGDLISNGLLLLPESPSPGTITFNGTTPISGDVAPEFGNVVVENTLAIEDEQQINVMGNFAVNGTFQP